MEQTKEKGVLLVTGIAAGLQEDMDNFPRPLIFDWLAVGMDAVDKIQGHLDYMSTYHPEDIPAAMEKRKACGGNTDYKVISHLYAGGVDIVEPFDPPSGSSALLGVLAALKMGYKKIILCGCPLQNLGVPDKEYEQFRKGWIAKYAQVMGKVKSMSGWTKEFLGAPTVEWLNDNTEPVYKEDARKILEDTARGIYALLEKNHVDMIPKLILTPAGMKFDVQFQYRGPSA